MPTQANISVATNNATALIFRVIHVVDGVRAAADLTGCRVDLDITFSGGKLSKSTSDGGLVLTGIAGQIAWSPTQAEVRTLPTVGTAGYSLSVIYPDGDSRAFTGRYVSALGGLIEIVDAGPIEVVEVVLPILTGPTGPAGPSGAAPLSFPLAGVSSFSAPHSYSYRPRAWLVDASGHEVETDVQHVASAVVVSFPVPFTGTLYVG